MQAETLFHVINYSTSPAWLLLIFAPRRAVTRVLVHSPAFPIALGLLHLVLVATADVPDGAGAYSLPAVAKMFATPRLALACWVHYLVFDLFVGAWLARDAQRHGLHHAAVVPCLLLTWFFGPWGLALYIGIRAVLRRRVLLFERDAQYPSST